MYSEYVAWLVVTIMLHIVTKLNKLILRTQRYLRQVVEWIKKCGIVNQNCYSSPKLRRSKRLMTSWSRSGRGRTRRLNLLVRMIWRRGRRNPSILRAILLLNLNECLLRWVLEHSGANVCFTVLQTLLYHTALQLFRHRRCVSDACVQADQLIVIKDTIH